MSKCELCGKDLIKYQKKYCSNFCLNKASGKKSHELSIHKYYKNPVICQQCGKIIEVKEGEKLFDIRRKKFCSKTCSAIYNNKKREEDGYTLKDKKKIGKCFNCGKEIEVGLNSQEKVYCDDCRRKRINFTRIEPVRRKSPIKKCSNCGVPLYAINKTGYCRNCLNKNTEYKSNIAKQLMKDGKISGWKSRNIVSYPEKFFQKVLDNNGFMGEYETNKPISKRALGMDDDSHYFLDFYLGKKIDLEIDGKQHDYEDRKESDKIRDEALIKHGYKVYRIKWNEINTDKGKQLMKKKIEDFLDFYNKN